jgi:hypothetical protein
MKRIFFGEFDCGSTLRSEVCVDHIIYWGSHQSGHSRFRVRGESVEQDISSHKPLE